MCTKVNIYNQTQASTFLDQHKIMLDNELEKRFKSLCLILGSVILQIQNLLHGILTFVTSHSGALRKLIFEDTCSQVIWTFMMLRHLSLIMMHYDR
jgi:hypothetical protein